MRVIFAVIAGPHQGETFSFEGHDTFLVGRSTAAHFRLPKKDEYFSRLHFLVEVNPPQCRLVDLNSTNGTLVNGAKITAIDLHDGDLIQGGQTTLRVSVLQDEAEPVTRRVPPAVPIAQPVTLPTIFPLAEVAATGSYPAGGPAAAAGRWPACDSPGRCAQTCLGEMGANRSLCPAMPSSGSWAAAAWGLSTRRCAPPDGSLVALKTISPADPDEVEAEHFLREAKILGALSI